MRWLPLKPRPLRNRKLLAAAVALTLLSALLFGVVVTLFATLQERQSVIQQSVREDATWAAYQLDRQVADFKTLVDVARVGNTPVAAAQASRYFDILYSRTAFLTQGQYAAKFAQDATLDRLAATARRQILEHTPMFDALAGRDWLDPAETADISRWLGALRPTTDQLLVGTNNRMNALRVEDREATRRTYWMIAATVLGLTTALALLVALLLSQLRHILRARAELLELSHRSAEAAASAEAGNRAKSVFLATMSHEIRTPLNGILGMVDLLEETGLTADQKNKLAIVRQSGDILLEVINDILDFSKLESGVIELEAERFDVGDILEAVRRIVRGRAEQKLVALSFSAPPLSLTGDPTRVKQILLNLVANAVKFTERGSVDVAVALRDTGRLRFEVKDTGPGIAPEGQKRLFTEFTQVDGSINRRFGGSGLGLAICKRLVTAMGGSIGVVSELGSGSLFWFEIPAVDCAPATAGAPAASAPLGNALAGRRVLVVEDNPTNLQVARGLLERLGIVVTEAVNGEMAVSATRAQAFDLILMDMQMPSMDGLSATRALRAAGLATTIVGLSANAFVSDREACLGAGMNDFVTKPINRSKLEAVLRRWLPATPVAAREPADAGVDRGQQRELIEELGQAVFEDLVSAFWSDAGRLSEAASTALSAADEEGLDRALHSLKGAAGTLGFVGIAQQAQSCRKVPAAARSDALERLRALVEEQRAAA